MVNGAMGYPFIAVWLQPMEPSFLGAFFKAPQVPFFNFWAQNSHLANRFVSKVK